MFQSPDLRERAMVVRIFHSVFRYQKEFRTFCRDEVCSLLVGVLNRGYHMLGVNEVLAAFIPVISGFRTPLSSENEKFFEFVLLPLYSCDYLHMFYQSLSSAVAVFLSKGPYQAMKIYKVLFYHWPVTDTYKGVIYLSETSNLMRVLPIDEDMELYIRLCKILFNCIAEGPCPVCERAISLFGNDEEVRKVICRQSEVSFPIVIPALCLAASTHWCEIIRSEAATALRSLKDGDLGTFENYETNERRFEYERIQEEVGRAKTWKSLIENASIRMESKDEKIKKLNEVYVTCAPEQDYVQDANFWEGNSECGSLPLELSRGFGNMLSIQSLPLLHGKDRATSGALGMHAVGLVGDFVSWRMLSGTRPMVRYGFK
jgi:hypothetical protein